MELSNGAIAELLALEADVAEGQRKRALGRAASAALLWHEEASELQAKGRPFTDLEYVGPGIARRLERWIKDPPDVPESPPQRSGFNTFAAAHRTVAADPSWRDELRGDLQMHTVYSDGKAALKDMADGGALLGYDYISITDHSGGLRVPRGMHEPELAAQGRAIGELNDELVAGGAGLTVLRSIEMNLDGDGAGDIDPAALGELDLVLGSFHSDLRSTDDVTERYLAALRNPDVAILGHPRTRRYSRRPGLIADWDRIFEVAAALDKALEINSHPHRQDLSIDLLEGAREAGVRLSIGTDAHDPSELRFVDMSLAAAMIAGIPKERIVNFHDEHTVREWARALRTAA